ncbi:hypothetical protein ACQ4PT_060290 [Festuca glaucescens]
MDEPSIFHLDFVKILEEVAEHFHLEPPVVSDSERRDGVGYRGAVYAQFKPDDESSFSTIYGYGEDAHEARNNAARETLKCLHFTVNFALVDLHMYEYWDVFLTLAQREQQQRMEISQLHRYYEARRQQELEHLEQEHDGCVYEIKHDLNLEIEDRDRWIEQEVQKSKKLKRERDMFEEMTNKQESQIVELMAENRNLRQKLAGKPDEEEAHSTTGI